VERVWPAEKGVAMMDSAMMIVWRKRLSTDRFLWVKSMAVAWRIDARISPVSRPNAEHSTSAVWARFNKTLAPMSHDPMNHDPMTRNPTTRAQTTLGMGREINAVML